MIRTNCSDCDSSNLGWFPGRELPSRVPAAERVAAAEVVAFFRDSLAADCLAWSCRDCAGFGVIESGAFGAV